MTVTLTREMLQVAAEAARAWPPGHGGDWGLTTTGDIVFPCDIAEPFCVLR